MMRVRRAARDRERSKIEAMLFPSFLALAMSSAALASNYTVDLWSITDFEELRPLIENCNDLGELEQYRGSLEAAPDLEALRDTLESIGHVEFRDCPEGVEQSGVERAR